MDQGLDSSMHGEHAYDEDAVRKFEVRVRLLWLWYDAVIDARSNVQSE